MTKLNPAERLELERLIAEQDAEDRTYVSQRDLSLDATVKSGETSTFLDLIDGKLADGVIQMPEPVRQAGRVTPERVKEWRHLRNKQGWTYKAIAEAAGVNVKTVRKHLAKRGKYDRTGIPRRQLEQHLDQFRAAYEAGASLREIAELHWQELGYRSWESCYQALRLALRGAGVQIRSRTMKHGKRSADASALTQRRYWREQQRNWRRKKLKPCGAVVKSGRPCRRWALRDSAFCVAHRNLKP